MSDRPHMKIWEGASCTNGNKILLNLLHGLIFGVLVADMVIYT